MVPKVDERKSNNEINSFKPTKKMDEQKSLNNAKTSIGNPCCDTINNKFMKVVNLPGPSSSSSDGQHNNKGNQSTNQYKFNRKKNLGYSKNERPSTSGKTMWTPDFNYRSLRKSYRRKLNQYKALVKILINARCKDLTQNIIWDTMGFLKDNRESEGSENILSSDGIEDNRRKQKTGTVSSATKNKIRAGKRREMIPDIQISKSQNHGVRKLIKISDTDRKIDDKNSTTNIDEHSADRYCNEFKGFDNKSPNCMVNPEKKCETDSDATIPSKIKIDENLSALDDIAEEKLYSKNTAGKSWIEKSLDSYEFDDSSIVNDSHETGKRSMENNNIREFVVNKNNEKSPAIGVQLPILKKTKQPNAKSKEKVGNNSIFIDDQSKNRETYRVLGKSSSVKTMDDKIEKYISKDLEKLPARENEKSNKSESNLKSKTAGKYCSCKRIKINKGVKTSAYAIKTEIQYPALYISKGYGNRSISEGKCPPSILEDEKIYRFGEKKVKKVHSPLELKYSEKMKLKLDPQRVSENRRTIINDSPETVLGSSLKKNKIISTKSKKGVSKSYNKFSISNFTLSQNRPINYISGMKFNEKTSSSSKLPTFSKYSIPVSIEINMTTDDLRKRLPSSDLIQSKITKYFPVFRGQNDWRQRKNVLGENSNSCLSKDFDENGNRIENTNNVAFFKAASRLLPIIESDVMLKNSEKVIYLKNYKLRKPVLSISHQDYLYGILNDSASAKTTTPNKNFVLRENIQPINAKEKSKHNTDLRITNDDNSSMEVSVIPPSFSILSNDQSNKSPIEMEMLDTQQREDLLAPWETLDIFEKINRWNKDSDV